MGRAYVPGMEQDEIEMSWWRDLPSVPAVTSILLRQQTRRRWNPTAVAHMLNRFPNLNEIFYEPWREWDSSEQPTTDECECATTSTAGEPALTHPVPLCR